jgi:L1 cell adhesion molecule like protein
VPKVAINPTNTIFDAKRLIGRKFNEPTVQADMKHWPFQVQCSAVQRSAVQCSKAFCLQVIDQDTLPKLKVEYKSESKIFTPEEISSMVLTKMKKTAEVPCSPPAHSY